MTEDFRLRAMAEARKPARGGGRSRKLVTTTRVNAGVWKEALRLSGGDARRSQIVSPTTVIVRDNGTRK
jgi:hypothetical protein